MRKIFVLCLAGLITWLACWLATQVQFRVFGEVIFPLSVIIGVLIAVGFVKIALARGWTSSRSDAPTDLMQDGDAKPDLLLRKRFRFGGLSVLSYGVELSPTDSRSSSGTCQSCHLTNVQNQQIARYWFSMFSFPRVEYQSKRICQACAKLLEYNSSPSVSSESIRQ